MATAGCPDETDLLAYVTGGSAPSVSGVVRGHLDDCDTCRQVVIEAHRAFSSPGGDEPPPAEPSTLDVGERLAGRYLVRRFLARGGMGEVYEVTDELLGERVALKTLACETLDRPVALARLRAEVQLARRVTHPNVCRILEFGVHERRAGAGVEEIPFFTMEYLDGKTLRRCIGEGGPLPEARVRALARELVRGLEAIHDAGIIHRDFKSENVFLVHEGGGERVVVMDFGLARPADERRRSFSTSGAVLGTTDYMAPEQLTGGAIDRRVDVYALGVVLFEALTGRLPFVGRTVVDAALKRMLAPAPRPSSVRPGIGPGWDEILGRCLSMAPERRYAAAAEVLAEIEAALTKPQRRSGRRRLVVGGAALVVAAALVGGVGALRGRAPRASKPAASASPPRPSPPVAPPPAATSGGARATEPSAPRIVAPPPPAAGSDLPVAAPNGERPPARHAPRRRRSSTAGPRAAGAPAPAPVSPLPGPTTAADAAAPTSHGHERPAAPPGRALSDPDGLLRPAGRRP